MIHDIFQYFSIFFVTVSEKKVFIILIIRKFIFIVTEFFFFFYFYCNFYFLFQFSLFLDTTSELIDHQLWRVVMQCCHVQLEKTSKNISQLHHGIETTLFYYREVLTQVWRNKLIDC